VFKTNRLPGAALRLFYPVDLASFEGKAKAPESTDVKRDRGVYFSFAT